MSESSDYSEVLQSERAVNERYRRQARKWLDDTGELLASVTSRPRNSIWTTPGVFGPRGELHPIVGRVAFDDATQSPVDGDLYIGPFIQELEGLTVVCWAARVAELFYRGTQSADVAAKHVSGRRTFTTVDSDLIDFADDLEPHVSKDVFRSGRSRRLSVPAPPTLTSARPLPPSESRSDALATTGSVQKPLPDDDAAIVKPKVPEELDVPVSDPALTEAGEDPPTVPAPADQPGGGINEDPPKSLRAESIVRRIINRPRTGKLSALLATLQADQHELVTWPAEQPLIVSGQPGTGKTIVAMHRAAFLTHPQRETGALKNVVVVGPTDEYRDHVVLVSESAGGARVPVVGLTELLCRIAGLDSGSVRPGPHDRLGVTWELYSTVSKVTRLLRSRGVARELSDQVLRELITIGPVHRECVSNPELSDWLTSIASPQKAKTESKYLPLMATIGSLTRDLSGERVDHLIVDEAQDVPPLVWFVLLSLVKGGRSLTILGDINQRRSDWTAASWEDLARDLELTDEDGNAPIRQLTTGYRSTRAILKFANQLLPRGERQNHALREGTLPTVRRIPRDQLVNEVRKTAIQISSARGPGLTAIISTDPRPFSDSFRDADWKRPPNVREAWTDGSNIIFVLHPDRARGLEFDSVIVVEPDAFPQNVGRDGVLYTSLTRATQDLHVLYSSRLPSRLRPPK